MRWMMYSVIGISFMGGGLRATGEEESSVSLSLGHTHLLLLSNMTESGRDPPLPLPRDAGPIKGDELGRFRRLLKSAEELQQGSTEVRGGSTLRAKEWQEDGRDANSCSVRSYDPLKESNEDRFRFLLT